MSHIINKLLGRETESDSHSSSTATETHTSASSGSEQKNSAGGQNSQSHTVQHEGVNIKSTISSDIDSTVSIANQKRLNDLVSKLGSTHTQIDEYAKKQTEKINDEIQREIDEVLARTRTRQDELLKRANEHTAQIDAEYRARLQKMVEEIDATKAQRIAGIEAELNKQQADILVAARGEIDQLNQKAANLKIGVLQQAQAKAATEASQVTAQAANLGQATTVHQASGTTTIKTEVSGAATTKETGHSTSTTGAQSTSTTGAQYSSNKGACADGSCSSATKKEQCGAGGAKTGTETHTSQTTQHQSNAQKH